MFPIYIYIAKNKGARAHRALLRSTTVCVCVCVCVCVGGGLFGTGISSMGDSGGIDPTTHRSVTEQHLASYINGIQHCFVPADKTQKMPIN